MEFIKFKNKKYTLYGNTPNVNEQAQDFFVTDKFLKDCHLYHITNKKNIIISSVPSLDTPVCSKTTITLNSLALKYSNTDFLIISNDLPFAQEKFCLNNKIKNLHILSSFRGNFGSIYGIIINEGPLKGLLARSIYIINKEKQIIYKEIVEDITQEPNLDKLQDYLI